MSWLETPDLLIGAAPAGENAHSRGPSVNNPHTSEEKRALEAGGRVGLVAPLLPRPSLHDDGGGGGSSGRVNAAESSTHSQPHLADGEEDGNSSRAEYLLSINKDNPLSDPKNLIVNYIPTPVTDEELRDLFEPFGTVESARVIRDRVTNHPKGYGFVKYTTTAAAEEAIRQMNGYVIGAKRLRVTQANGPCAPQPPTPVAAAAAAPAPAAPPMYISAITQSAAGGIFPPAAFTAPTAPSTTTATAAPGGGGVAFVPYAPPAKPQEGPPVFFAATAVAGGYRLNPQPLTLTAAGGTVTLQPIAAHTPSPSIFVGAAPGGSSAATSPSASTAEMFTQQQQQQQQQRQAEQVAVPFHGFPVAHPMTLPYGLGPSSAGPPYPSILYSAAPPPPQ